MAILSKVKMNPQQRLDLEDWNAAFGAIETDWKFWTKQFLSASQYILKGFQISGLGAPSPVSVSLTNATLINANNSNCFSFFVAQDGASPLSVTLQPNQRNYLELVLSTTDDTPLTRAFWDPTGNSGDGIEFTQTVDTITDLNISIEVNTSAFTGSADRIPLAIIDTDGSNNVVLILDKRPMFFRLGQPGNVENDFNWNSQTEPSVELSLSSVSGTFQAGETLNFTSGASAILLSGTSSPLQTIKFSSDSFVIGDTVTGANSGASGTLSLASESFSGADKDISNFKDILDAIMTEIKRLKGTDFWFEDASQSMIGLYDQLNSILVQNTSNARFEWSGTALSITDDNGSPNDSDVVGLLSILGYSGTLSLTREDGTGSSSSISLSDGEVVYIELPNSGNRIYSGVGSLSTNYKVIAKDSFISTDSNYWLAYRSGAKLYLRGLKELEPGENHQIGDEISTELLDALGLPENDSTPNYTSDIRGAAGESFLNRISTLTLNQGDEQEDRSGFLRSNDPIIWDGNDLSFISNIELRIPNTKTGSYATYTVSTAQSPISLTNGEMAYVELDRTSPGALSVSLATSLPAQTQSNKDIIVLFQRIDAPAGNFLHIPFHKQVLRQGQSVFLGASGSGEGVSKVDLHDPLSTTLPTGTSATIDNISIIDGDLVLFSNLSSGNNRIYKASGVGSSIVWTAQFSFVNGLDPEAGDLVIVQRGDSFAIQVGKFTGTNWEFNKTTRYFDGANYVEFESIKTVTLTDATVDQIVFSTNAINSDNWMIFCSISRGTDKEVKTLHLTHDGINASVSESGTTITNTGVDFSADINAGNLRLLSTTTNTGNNATLKFFYFRWNDANGGSGGVPNYSGAASTTITAAGSTGDVQYKDSGGGLAASSDFKFDNALGSIILGLTEIVKSQTPITILDNQISATLYSYNASTYSYAIIEYGLERDGAYRTGRMMLANDGTNVGFSDDGTPDIGSGVGVTFDAIISGANVLIRYSTDLRSINGTFNILQIRRS